MLSANLNETPRPRPPAKARRSSSLKVAVTPPPSYAFALSPESKPPLEGILGSPLLATFQRVGWDLGKKTQLSPMAEDDQSWINDRSREELSELLVKAEGLIRERENDLGAASAVVKSLYENNVVLKNKHQALLKRLPSSPLASPSPDFASSRTSRYSISLSRPVSEYEASPLTYKSQARKISFSQAEIAQIADQNAELLEKLERMEEESAQTDYLGRRDLKRLEKEILFLREELEKTQAKSEELEEKTKAGFGWDPEKAVQDALRRREERENKFRALRNASQTHVDSDHQLRNFAPEGSAFGALPSLTSPLFHPPSFNDAHSSPDTNPPAQPEHSVISQLLDKIAELERTNNHILEQQTETNHQLSAMQRETEQIGKLYDYFADEEEVIEISHDSGLEEDPGCLSADETIRFLSLKKTLGSQLAVTPRKDRLSQTRNSRPRKSVMGLFEPVDGDHSDSTPSRGSPTPGSIAFPLMGTHRSHQSPESRNSSLASPAFSTVSMSSSRSHPSDLSSFRRTLETELGNDFNNGWGTSLGHHCRTDSLYMLAQMSVPASPSISREVSPSRNGDTLPTPSSLVNPTLRLEPPTPLKDIEREARVRKQSIRLQRMSETVRLRTNRWVDGRFAGPKGSVTEMADPSDGAALTPLSLRLTSAFDDAVLNATGASFNMPATATSQNEDRPNPLAKVAKLPVAKKRNGLRETMVQVWLWLQFAIVIFIFVWSMARRGPQSVLGQRRVAASANR